MARLILPALTAGVLLLATPALAGETLEARSYDLSSLTGDGSEALAPSLGLIRKGYMSTISLEDEDESSLRLALTHESLTRFLLQDLGRAGTPKPTRFLVREGALRVLAPKSTQAEIAASLGRIRAQVERHASLEVRLVSLSPSQAARLGVAGAPLDAKQLALVAEGKSLGKIRLVARDRSPTAGSILERSTFLGDFEVNQTGTIPVLNSVVEALLEGVVAEVTCRLPLSANGSVLLDCRVEAAHQAGKAREMPFPGAGSIDLPTLDHVAFGGTLRLNAGESAVLGLASLKGSAEAAQVVVALVSLRSVSGRAPIPAKALALRVYDLSRVQDPTSFSFQRPTWPSDSGGGGGGTGVMGFSEEEEGGVFLNQDQIRHLVLSRVDPGAWASANGKKSSWVELAPAALAVAHTAEGHERLTAFLDALQPMPTPLRYELLVLNGLQAPNGGPVLSPDDCKALANKAKAGRYSLSGLPNQEIELVSRREQRFVSDIERSGGGEVQSTVQVDDPIVESLAAGIALRLKGSVTGDSILVDADLDLRGIPTLRLSKTQWGYVELYSASHLHARRQARVVSGGGIVLATQSGKTPRTYVLRVYR